jgi:two-component system response regulator AtoC
VSTGELPAEGFGNIITCDQGMLDVLALVQKVAGSDLTVLLRGETGTGKGMIAWALHRLSPRPVGSSEERQVDVRIVCASKSDLHGLVQGDSFLEDLYFRLLDFPLVVPPLRERPGDIPLLTRHFVQKYGLELGGAIPEVGNDVMDALCQYDWPGNIRELEKCLKRALVLAQGEPRLRVEHLPRELTPYLAASGRGGLVPLRETLAAVESREIAQALKACGGNKSAAARLLQVSYPNLLKKIKLYGL